MLFRLANVTKTYGKIIALHDLSVEAAEGAVGLLGPNGAGKTTLIRTLLGLIGIDPAGRQEMVDLARDLARGKGMSLLFSSHLLPDVEAVCDHVIVLGRGRLLAQGAIREMKLAHPGAYEVRLKGDPEPFLARLR